MELIIFIILITLGYVSGTIVEKKHYRSIENREEKFLSLPAVTIKKCGPTTKKVEQVRLVSGNAVISVDYFKRILAGLRNVFGGRVKSYESLIDRARREAILRMKREALFSDVILNIRVETSSIGQDANRKKNIGSIEAFAYGTAVTYRK